MNGYIGCLSTERCSSHIVTQKEVRACPRPHATIQVDVDNFGGVPKKSFERQDKEFKDQEKKKRYQT